MFKKYIVASFIIFCLFFASNVLAATTIKTIVKQKSTQADPTSNNSATFKVLFSEPIVPSSFDSSDINILGTATGTITSGPTEVAPNDGTSFEFEVTGMSSGDTVSATINSSQVNSATGDDNFSSANGGADDKLQDSPVFQAIATNGASDWEFFTIGTDKYLALANYSNGSSGNINSKIYKWNSTTNQFDFLQNIATHKAFDWEAFTIGSDAYLVVANYQNSSYNINSVVYKWNSSTNQFDTFQNIATQGAYDWEAFTIGSDAYLVVANYYNYNHNINSVVYKWNTGTNQFDSVQSIPTHAAIDWESFDIGSDKYLVVANRNNGSSFNINSVVYKWNSSTNQFNAFQNIATQGASGWEAFDIAGEQYLAVANYYNGSTRNINSKIYKWNSTTNQFDEIQSIATNGAFDWKFAHIGDEDYLAVANQHNDSSSNVDSKIYKWNTTTNQFDEVQSIATHNAYDWEVFDIESNTYFAVANLYNGSSYNLNSIIYNHEVDNEITYALSSTFLDLKDSSDTGVSNTDNNTSDDTPTFSVNCTSNNETLTLYSDNPSSNTQIGSYNCTSTCTVDITSSQLSDGLHNITYTHTVGGSESSHSPALAVTIDTTAPTQLSAPTVDGGNNPTADSTPSITGSCTNGDLIIAKVDNIDISPTTTCSGGTYTINPTSAISDGTHNFSVYARDIAGNESSVSSSTSTTINTALLANDFVITVHTSNVGSTSNTQFRIPTHPGETYNYNVDCNNDGTDEVTGATGDYTCNYSTPGTYSIRIKDNTGSGNGFPRIYFNNSGDKLKLVGINQWGTMHWSSMENAFYGCSFVNDTGTGSLGVATDAPDLSNVTSLASMFREAQDFNQPINSWDTSHIIDMSNMFRCETSAASFNQNLNLWNTSSVTNMSGMFYHAQDFNQQLSSWNTANVLDFSYMFYGAQNFNQALNSWNTSSATDMNHMFMDAQDFNQPLNSWDTSHVTDISNMFSYATSFNQPLNSWDTSSVTNMAGMFYASQDFNQPLNSWDTSNVWYFGYMFYGAQDFNQPLNSWDTSNSLDMSGMFAYATSFNQPLNSWDTSSVNNMNSMFLNASVFNQNLASWHVDNVSNMLNMFTHSNLSDRNYDSMLIGWDSRPSLRINVPLHSNSNHYCNAESARNDLLTTYNWSISDSGKDCSMADFIITVKTDNSGSSGNTQFEIPTYSGETYNYNVDCNNDGTDEVTGATGDYTCNYSTPGTYSIRIKDNTGSGDGFPRIYFRNAGDPLKLVGINQWGTMHWSSMENAFYGCTNVNDTGTGSLGEATDTPDLSNVTDLGYMFSGASSFNQSLNSWDISNVDNLHGMFYQATSFNKPLNLWDTSNVTDMADIFAFAQQFNQSLNSWNTHNVTNMSHMFYQATSFNQPLNSWDTRNVTNMQSMFSGAYVFNQPLNSWDTHNVTDMYGMFTLAYVFNQPLNSWDTSNVTSMGLMFWDAYEFNQPLNSWDTHNVTEMNGMFGFTQQFNQPLNSWDTHNVTNMQAMFEGAEKFNQPLNSWDTHNTTDMSHMFDRDPVFNQDISSWNTSNVANMKDMFNNAQAFDQNLAPWHVDNVTDMTGMFTNSNLSDDNYNSILIGWNSRPSLKNNTTLDSNNNHYCSAEADRAHIISTYSWTINDAGKLCPPSTPMTPPDLQDSSDTGISQTDDYTSDSTPTFDVNCPASGNSIDLFIGSTGSYVNVGTHVCASSGTESIISNNLSDGVYSFTYTVTDSVGQSGNSPALEVTIDNSLPNPPILTSISDDTGVSNSDNITYDKTLYLHGTAQPNLTVEVFRANDSIGATQTDGNGNFTFDYTSVALDDGEYVFTAKAIDPAGNVSAMSSDFNVVVDTLIAPPTVTSPVSNSTVTDLTPTFIGTGEPTFTIEVDDHKGHECSGIVDSSGNWSCEISTELSEGNNQVFYTVQVDLAGNKSNPAIETVLNVGVDTDEDGIINTLDQDDDGDGIDDDTENIATNGDGNGDDIKDSLQSNVVTQRNTQTEEYTTMQISEGCEVVSSYKVLNEDDLEIKDNEYDYPLGLNDFVIKCTNPGESAKLTFYYDQDYDISTWQFRKYNDRDKKYSDFKDRVKFSTSTVNSKKVTVVEYTIKDGSDMDTDGKEDGVIHDPAGPARKPSSIEGNSSIGDTVWLDSNHNGSQDDEEKGLKNIRMKAIWYGPNGIFENGKGDDEVFKDKTDKKGHYKIKNLPVGKYRVMVNKKDVKKYVQTYENSNNLNDEININLDDNEYYKKADFGYSDKEWELAKTGDNIVFYVVTILLSILYMNKKYN